MGVAAFHGVVVGCDKQTIAFAPDPDRHTMRRAVGEQGGEMSEVAAINQAKDFGGEFGCNAVPPAGTLLCW